MDMWQSGMTAATGVGRVSRNDYEAAPMVAEGDLPFGVAAKLGTDPATQVATFDGANGSVLAGIVMDNGAGDRDNLQYKDHSPAPIIKKGHVWVKVLELTATGDTVKIDHTTGNFRPSGTATQTVTALSGAIVTKGAAKDGLAELEINLP